MTEASSSEPLPDATDPKPPRKVAIMGEIPFAGRALAQALIESGASVRVLCPDSAAEAALKSLPQAGGIEIVEGDVGSDDALSSALSSVNGLCFVSPISMHGRMYRDATHVDDVRRVVRAAESSAVQKLVYHSAVGANAGAQSRALRDAAAAEELVSNARCGGFRVRTGPLMGRGDRFLSEIVANARTGQPFMGVMGYGGTLVQPLGVEDFGRAIAEIFVTSSLTSGLYALVGPETRSLLELTDSALGLARRFKIKLHAPLFLLKMGAAIGSRSFAERVNLLFDAHAVEQNDAAKLLGSSAKLVTPLEVERELLAG